MATQQVEYIETAHGRLAYRVDGEGGETPLLLTQRYRGTLDDWESSLVDALATNRKVIRFDSAGIGRSEGDTPNSVPDMAKIALAFMDAMGLDKVDALGWSLGGYVASHLALLAPARVRHLIIAGSGPGGVSGSPPPHPHVVEVVGKDTITPEDFDFLFFTDTPVGRAAAASYQKRLGSPIEPVTRLASANRQWEAIKAYVSGGDATYPHLEKLTMPILVANGVHDVMVPAENAFAISQKAPNAKLVLYPDAGHGFLFQYSKAFANEVDQFLRLN